MHHLLVYIIVLSLLILKKAILLLLLHQTSSFLPCVLVHLKLSLNLNENEIDFFRMRSKAATMRKHSIVGTHVNLTFASFLSSLASPTSGMMTPNTSSSSSSSSSEIISSKVSTSTSSTKDFYDSASRHKMMVERGRAFTFPDIGVQNPRARTVSERAEEIDLVSTYVCFQ